MKERSKMSRWWSQVLKETIRVPFVVLVVSAIIEWLFNSSNLLIIVTVVLAAANFIHMFVESVNKVVTDDRTSHDRLNEIAAQKDCENFDLRQSIKSLITTLASNLVLPIWQTHGKNFEVAPGAARDLRRRLGTEILAAVQLLPMEAEEIALLFGGDVGLIEDTVARATKAGKLAPDSDLRGDLIRLIAELRLAQAATEEPTPTVP